MNQLDTYLEGFKLNYEKFLLGCDALEAEGLWPLEDFGEMDAYFANDLMCVIIRLIAADGEFDQAEIDYLNDALGFGYSVEELSAVYTECGEKINSLLESELSESISQIQALSPLLADTYKEMLSLVCKIMIESDGVITSEEKTAASQLLSCIE